MAAELDKLNARRQQLIDQIRQAADSLAGGENPFPWRQTRATASGAPARRSRKKGGRRKGFKMSKAARAKISAAQKARWAKQKKQG